MKKVYVKVIAEFDIDGKIKPLFFVGEDEKSYQIDISSHARRAASFKAGGTGYRYDIVFDGEKGFLWLEDTEFNKVMGARWFITKMPY